MSYNASEPSVVIVPSTNRTAALIFCMVKCLRCVNAEVDKMCR